MDEGGGRGKGAGRPEPSRPPELARRWLARVAPPDDRDVVVGELDEAYRLRHGRDGARRARWWYRRQVAGFTVRAGSARRATAHRIRGEGGMGGFEAWVGDVRWAVRGLGARPTFTLVAVATLALGIGANSAVFTLASAHFLAPLPYGDPDRVVLLWETNRGSDEPTTVAPGNYATWRAEASSFADVAAYNVASATLSGDGAAERVTAADVVPHFFRVLGVAPALGAGFDEAAVREADGRVVVLGHGLWTRRYGADPDVVGTDIRVDGRPHTVVGVLPPDYRQPERSLRWQGAELWLPMLLDEESQDFSSRYLRTLARLAPGVTATQAREEMDAMASRMAEAYPEANGGRRIQVWTLDDYLLGDARPVMWMLLLAAATVLVVVCANVANLTLARGQERRREFAVRAALGSGRLRLVRQVLVESVVLALAGAAVGAALVYGGLDLLQAVQVRFFSNLIDVRLDPGVLAGTTAVALGAGLLFGVPLALSASATDLRGALTQGDARSGRAAGVTQNLLIVGQVALATTLVVVAGLLTRSFAALVDVPPGFDAEDVLAFTVSAPRAAYPDRQATEGYLREVWREVEAVPGVQAVGMVSDLPFTTENRWTTLRADDVPYDASDPPTSDYKAVTPEYFGVMGIPVLAGGLPEDAWSALEDDVPVAVNQRLAERFWPGQDPLGRTLETPWQAPTRLRVAAVVGNVLDDGFDAAPEPLLYLPWGATPQGRMSFVLSTPSAGPELLRAVREAVGRVDPDVPAAELGRVADLMAETVARPRAASLIGGLFAALSLLVASAGIYGVLSYLVQRRTREIGIRSALGASRDQIVRLVMGHSTRLVGVGLALGLGGALLAARALSALLFGVRPWDPVSLLGAAALLGLVGTVAAWVPARRAVRVDPREALRAE